MSTALNAHGGAAGRIDFESETFVAEPVAFRVTPNDGAYQQDGVIAALTTGTDATANVVAFGITADALDRTGEASSGDAADRAGLGVQEGLAYSLKAARPDAVAYSIMPQNSGKDYKARAVDVAQPLMAAGPVGGNQGGDVVAEPWAVRRLTPTECERLMGVSDGFTNIVIRKKPAADGPRYKVLGNSQGRNQQRFNGHGLAAVIRARRAAGMPA